MLSRTFSKQSLQNVALRTNIMRDVSRILLSVCRVPLPRVGSFIIDNTGFLCLANRPYSLEMTEVESEAIPTNIARDCTYTTSDSYVIDLLALHDSRLLHQPNAVNSIRDSISQMSALTAMRTTFPLFFRRDLRRGPFCFDLTDLHQSNIFVDNDWHITCLIDLEWAYSRPIEMITPPIWLMGKTIDEITREDIAEAQNEFINILREEEKRISNKEHLPLLSDAMDSSWKSGAYWFTLALYTPTGLHNMFYRRILPLFQYIEDGFEVMTFFWSKDASHIARCKVKDKEDYDVQLQQKFEEN